MKKIRNGNGAKPTAWFEDRSITPPVAPPSARELPDAERGDLFFHNGPTEAKFWILHKSEDHLVWKNISLGYTRKDGRKLSITEGRGEPSWVGDEWFDKRAHRMSRNSISASASPLTYRSTPSTKKTPARRSAKERSTDKTSIKNAPGILSDGDEEAQETSVQGGDSSFHASSSSE